MDTWICDWIYKGSQREFVGKQGTMRTHAADETQAQQNIRNTASQLLFGHSGFAAGFEVTVEKIEPRP